MMENSQLQLEQSLQAFRYFEELCRIPHGSGNIRQISDYLVDFAKGLQLEFRQDEMGNVIIKKPATKGYETAPTVMLQGHMDMVCIKEAGSPHNFETDALDLYIEDGYLKARGTTLGGDDGVAVAYAMALLAADDLAHPALEVLITVDEEIGLLGAAGLDASDLKADILLNLDSEDEGIFFTGCAGGRKSAAHFALERERVAGTRMTLSIGGLCGGHSGAEIDKNRANANQLMGRMLYELEKEFSFRIIAVNGGEKDNAITSLCEGELVALDAPALAAAIGRYQELFAHEYCVTEPQLKVTCEQGESGQFQAATADFTHRLISFMHLALYGVMGRSQHQPELIETSLNMGVLQTTETEVVACFGVRSSLDSKKIMLSNQIENLTKLLGGYYTFDGDYPGWEYEADSRIRELVEDLYRRQYQAEPIFEEIHAGLECGLLKSKMPQLDCISFGPNMIGAHTPLERLELASFERVWRFLVALLAAVTAE